MSRLRSIPSTVVRLLLEKTFIAERLHNTKRTSVQLSCAQTDTVTDCVSYALVLRRVCLVHWQPRLVNSIVMVTATQPLLVDALLAPIKAFLSRTNPSASAVLLLDICVEGTNERETFRISVPRNDAEGSTSCSSSPTSLSSTGQVNGRGVGSNHTDHDVEAERLQQLALDDDHVADRSISSPIDDRSIRHSLRTRTPVQRFDYLVAASSHSAPRTRKRPAASTETEEERSDSAKEDDGDSEATARTGPARSKRQSTRTATSHQLPHADTSKLDEVALLGAKLRAGCTSRPLSTMAVSTDAIARLGREVLLSEDDGENEQRCADTAHKIAVLISTSTALRMVGYYLRSVLAVRLKATHRSRFTEAARRLLGIKSTADIAAYPAFYSFVQQHCSSVACAQGVVDVEAWLKEPVLVADISWTAWRRYLCKPNRWMLDRAMEQLCTNTTLPSPSLSSASSTTSTLLSPGSSSSSPDVPAMTHSSDMDEADEAISSSDVEMDSGSDTSDTQQRSRRKRAKPVWTAAMTVSGHVLDAATNTKLRLLRREHHRLTKDIWNSHSYQLAEHDEDVPVGTTNGEMRQAPFCELLQTLLAHPSIPLHARLQSEQAGAEHFWLDVGSGYELAVLRAKLLTRAKVCAGVEIAEDRVSISHRLAGQMGMQEQVHFVASDVCHSQVLPILLAATHIFAYSAVFSPPTQDYLAHMLARPDSSWLVYVTCDKTDVLERAGVDAHTEPHGSDCQLGGVHLLGRTRPLSMSVSKQSFSACIYLRCVPASAGARAAAWATGMATLLESSAAAALRASEEMNRTLTSSPRRETRSTRQSAALSTG